jgi:hypothetical protein
MTWCALASHFLLLSFEGSLLTEQLTYFPEPSQEHVLVAEFKALKGIP